MGDMHSAIMSRGVIRGCAVWVHHPAGRMKDTAILLCQGAGQDYSNGYRPVRVMADFLAKAGFPILRFDYPGTGDSADMNGGNLWEAWQESVEDLANWLRTELGAARIVFAGIRIGAVLAAMEAARRDDMAGLVLFEPFFSARSFVTQLVAESRMRGNAAAGGDTGDGVAVGELHFSAYSMERMRAADITRLQFASMARVVVFARSESVKILARLMPWREQGMELTVEGFSDFDALLRPNRYSGDPEIAPGALLAWLEKEVQAELSEICFRGLADTLGYENYEEKLIRFGEQEHLAGLLCRPEADGRLAVLICNSGGNPHHGFARFSVALARKLAAVGIASFRFDFAGQGDSVLLEQGEDIQSDVFLQDRLADFRAAMDVLEENGFRRFAVHGLCSGAFHAVRASLEERRIESAVMVNLPWFSLRRERPGPESMEWRSIRTFQERGLQALFIFSAGDAGLVQFERNFGEGGRALDGMSGIRVAVDEDIDHELTERWMQDIVIRKTINFLEGQKTRTQRNDARQDVLEL